MGTFGPGLGTLPLAVGCTPCTSPAWLVPPRFIAAGGPHGPGDISALGSRRHRACSPSIIPLLCLAGVVWPGVPRARRAAAPFPILAAPSWVGGSAASCFSVFPRFVNIINNEKQPGVYNFALIYAFGFFLRGNQLRFSDEPSSSQQLSETLAMNCIQSAASTFVCGLDK